MDIDFTKDPNALLNDENFDDGDFVGYSQISKTRKSRLQTNVIGEQPKLPPYGRFLKTNIDQDDDII